LPNLPILGTLPASPRPLLIVDSEISGTAAIATGKLAQGALFVQTGLSNNYVSDRKQTVNAGATQVGFRDIGAAADPSSQDIGDLYFRTDLDKWRTRLSGSIWDNLVSETIAATLENKDLSNANNTFDLFDTDINASALIAISKLATLAANRVMGSIAGGVPIELTPLQLTTIPNIFTSALKGLVPASGGSGTDFLSADGTFKAAGGGTGSYRLARLEGSLISTDREALNWLDSSKINFTVTDDGASDETEITATIVADSLVNADINTGAAILQSKLAAIALGDLPNLPVLGTLPASPRQLLIVNSEISATALIAFSKLANAAANTVLGQIAGGSPPIALTATQLTTIPNVFTSALKGLVPASGGSASEFLGADGTFKVPPVSGSPLTTKGDIYSFVATDARLPVGADDTVLVADDTPSIGLAYKFLANINIDAAAAIALTKLANINTNRLLGRNTAAAGSIEELTHDATLEFNVLEFRRAAITGDVSIPVGSNVAAIGSGVIVNADINASAAIALDKLASIIFTKGGTTLDPTGAINILTWRAPFACTVTNVRGNRIGGTGATINARKNGADNHLSSALSLTSADTWADGGAVSNTSYAAGDDLEIMIVTVAGTPTQIAIQVEFTKD